MVAGRKRGSSGWLIAGLGVLIVLACGGAAALYLSRPAVQVTEVVEGPVVQAFYATGTLQPDHEFPIRSNVEGILTEMLVDKGSLVKAGDKLAFVSVDDLQLKFQQAKAELELKAALADDKNSPTLNSLDEQIRTLQEQQQIAEREVKRVQDLVARNAASTTDYDRALDRLKQLSGELQSLRGTRGTRKLELDRDAAVAKAALEIAQWNVDQQTIRSPVEGVVLDRPQPRGTRVRVNDHLMQVADVRPENLVMRAQVDEEDKAAVQLGQKVKLTLYSFPGEVFEGMVKRIYPKADEQRRTFEVDVTMRLADPRFSPGMTGELAFIAAEKARAMVVPSNAVQGGQVWVVEGGRATAARPELGLKSIERVEICAGLKPGQQIVFTPTERLKEGARVRAEYVAPKLAAEFSRPAEEKPMSGFIGGK